MMLGWLRRSRSFSAKVTWALTAIGGLAVMLVSVALVVFSYFDLAGELRASVEAQARLVAMNSTAPLAFRDAVSGRQALAAMRATPSVGSATVFDAGGRAFARFERPGRQPPTLEAQAPGLRDEGGWQVLTVPVEEGGERLGTLQVAYDLERLERRMLDRLLVALGVAAAAMLLIYAVSRALRGVLVGPVDELAQVARDVSQTRNYGLRVRRLSNDETAQAADAFNEMLARIQQQHGELQAARRDAERASQMKDDFLATLSHELRTPMAPILGWAQILRRAGPDAARVQQGAEIIERNARIQTQIIDDLLDMSRIVSGKLLLRTEALNPRAVCEAALATVQSTADARGVRLESRLEPVPWLKGDPNRLQQVVWNLLANAIKFTPKGGRVTLSLSRVGDEARIEVSDSGQGIAPDFLPHVFERFRQADSSTTRAHGGLGIGLSITRQLVELHGGRVEAASEGEGRGATFTVSLPLPDGNAPEIRPAGEPAPVSALPLQGARLLVVDDDADGRGLLAQLLAEAGAVVDCAASAEEALALLRERRPDVLVSDIGMPVMDGYELLARVRRLPEGEGGGTPAIALTAFVRSEDRDRALLAGFQQHLGKPVEADKLIAAASTLLRRAKPVS